MFRTPISPPSRSWLSWDSCSAQGKGLFKTKESEGEERLSAAHSQPLPSCLRLLLNCSAQRDLRRSLLSTNQGQSWFQTWCSGFCPVGSWKAPSMEIPQSLPAPLNTWLPTQGKLVSLYPAKPSSYSNLWWFSHPPDTQSSEELVSNFSKTSFPVLENCY